MKIVTEAVDAVLIHGKLRDLPTALERSRALHARYHDVLADVLGNAHIETLVAALADITDDEESRAVVMERVVIALANGVMVGIEMSKVELEDVYGADPNREI